MTLAFELEAFEALAHPKKAFADARQWSQHVGVVADDTRAAKSAIRRHGIKQDYEIGPLDAQSVLSRLKWEADTERYVFVGIDDRDQELANYVGWEYLSVEEAAEQAGWQLAEDLTFLERVRVRFTW